MDIDNFKAINAADLILIRIGDILKEFEAKGPEWWQQQDIAIKKVYAFHLGGDEYALMVEGEWRRDQIKTQQIFYGMLRDQINDIQSGQRTTIGITTGVCLRCNKDADIWLKYADEAAEKIKKKNSKNSICVYDGYTKTFFDSFEHFASSVPI